MTGSPSAGDMLEASLWYNSLNPLDKVAAQRGVRECLEIMAQACGLLIGDIIWEDIGPEDGRVPEPPEAYYGAPMCLYGQAPVVAARRAPVSAFTHELEDEDLERVRTHTRKAAAGYGQYLSDEECDEIINRIGPDAAVARLRDGAAVH